MQCSVQCAVCSVQCAVCSAVQCSAVCSIVPGHELLHTRPVGRAGLELDNSAVQCSAVQCSAVQCSAVQSSPVQSSSSSSTTTGLLRQLRRPVPEVVLDAKDGLAEGGGRAWPNLSRAWPEPSRAPGLAVSQ
jgi:hypothetical protein